MSTTFIILMAVTIVLVLASLVLGLVSMLRGGEFNKKHGNNLMRARVGLQGLAILLFILAFAANGA